MPRHFYDDKEPTVASSEGPLVPDLVIPTDVSTTTLSTGNQIYDSKTLNIWFNDVRSSLINRYQVYKTEWETQKSAASNEWNSVKDYTSDNILTDSYENQELLVPASALALGAFFSGRVLSNRNNWGFVSPFNNQTGVLARNPTLAAKLLTSIPSRIVLPWVLAGTVFSQLVPVTWSNGLQALEKDIFPASMVSQYHEVWDKLHTNGLGKKWKELNEYMDDSLQRNIGHCRTFLVKKLGI
ncbi:LANO_0H13498g1_1 [Lachancea nothofagi CBS 11611]|uniref:LANO_0H13498g1_1 n=1 Tax=Lachancea nothofagi CBS 11611 TaxID=1266666 RepID=A0A1G4KML7_9SACH|nr:LANO_0H13498g1_1 [Lachancea nothofagi CBS 11611]